MTQEQLNDIWQKQMDRKKLNDNIEDISSRFNDPRDPMGTLAVTVLDNEDTKQKMIVTKPDPVKPFSDFNNVTEQETVIYCRIRGNTEEKWGDWLI